MDLESSLTSRWCEVIEKNTSALEKGLCPWIWRNGAFAGQFADAFIQNTNLEGGDVPTTLETLLRITKPLFMDEFLRSVHLELLTDDNIAQLHKLYDDLHKTIEYGRELAQIRNSTIKFANFLEKWITLVSQLPVGERLIINGGWLVARKDEETEKITGRGHATVYIIERDEQNKYGFVVVNTGEGNDYHPFHRGDYPKEKRRAAIRIGDITRERILEEGFWFLLFKMRYQSSSVHGPIHLYEVLLPFLANPNKPYLRDEYPPSNDPNHTVDYIHDLGVLENDKEQPTRIFDCTFAVNLDRQMRKGLCGDFETMQRSGTCFHRALLGTVRYCAKRMGFTLDQRKQLLYAFRMAFLFNVKYDLLSLHSFLNDKLKADHNYSSYTADQLQERKLQIASQIPKLQGGWQYSDIQIISVACDVTALAAVKEAKRGTMDKNGLYLIRSLTNSIRSICQNIGRGVGAPVPIQIDEFSSLCDHPHPPTPTTTNNNDNDDDDNNNGSASNEGSCLSSASANQQFSDRLKPFLGMESFCVEPTAEMLERFSGANEAALDTTFVNLYDAPSHHHHHHHSNSDRNQLSKSDESFTHILQVIEILVRSQKRCEGLLTKIATTSISIPLHQICSLIEHLVCERIPFPKPRSKSNNNNRDVDDDGNEGCIWKNKQSTADLSLDDQRRGLEAIHKLALFYISSSYSLSIQDKQIETSRTITLFALLCIFEALVRINHDTSTPHLSPIGYILEQQEMYGERPFWISTNGYLENISLKSLFPNMIVANPSHLSTLVNILLYYYESDIPLNLEERSGSHVMYLFDWKVDPIRRITQFRVDTTDCTLDFVQCLLDLNDHKFSVVNRATNKSESRSSSDSSPPLSLSGRKPNFIFPPSSSDESSPPPPPPPPPISLPREDAPFPSSPSSSSSSRKEVSAPPPPPQSSPSPHVENTENAIQNSNANTPPLNQSSNNNNMNNNNNNNNNNMNNNNNNGIVDAELASPSPAVPKPPPLPIIRRDSTKPIIIKSRGVSLNDVVPPPAPSLPPPPPLPSTSPSPSPALSSPKRQTTNQLKLPTHPQRKKEANSEFSRVRSMMGDKLSRYLFAFSAVKQNAPPPTLKPEIMDEFELKIKCFCDSEPEWKKRNCPEFAWLRNIICLAKLTIEPTAVFFERNPFFAEGKFNPPETFLPAWHYQDVTNSVKCGFKLCSQKLLCLGSTHPESPTKEENYTFMASSFLPKSPHFLVDLMAGKKPIVNNQQRKEIVNKITEDDVYRIELLPTFENSLKKDEVLQLISLLTVPYLNIPLILNFYANNLIGALVNPKLQQILEFMLFENRDFNSQTRMIDTIPLPPSDRIMMGSKYGLMIKELTLAADCIFEPLLSLIDTCCNLCIGSFDSPFGSLLLFFIRITTRILRDYNWIRTSELKSCLAYSEFISKLMECLKDQVVPKVMQFIDMAAAEDNITSSVILRSHLVILSEVIIHYEDDIFESNVTTVGYSLPSLLANASYVVSWHSKIAEPPSSSYIVIKDLQPSELYKQNRLDVDEIKITRPLSSIPLFEVFYVIERMRNTIIQWCSSKPIYLLEPHLLHISKLSLHLIGDGKASKAASSSSRQSNNNVTPISSSEDNNNDYNDNNIVVDEYNLEEDEEEEMFQNMNLREAQSENILTSLQTHSVVNNNDNQNDNSSLWKAMKYEHLLLPNNQNVKGIYRHSTENIEVNLQTLEVYFKNRSLVPTPPEVLAHPDFTEVIPSEAQPYCVISSTKTNTKLLHVLHDNTCFHIETWGALTEFYGLKNFPTFSEDGNSMMFNEKKYSTYKRGSLGWFSQLFDNALREETERAGVDAFQVEIFSLPRLNENENIGYPQLIFYVHPSFTKKKKVKKEAVNKHGRYFLVHPIHNKKCFHVYAIIEIGRRMKQTLVYTSNSNWCNAYFMPSCNDRNDPWYPGLEFSAGNMFQYVFEIDGHIDKCCDIVKPKVDSIIIRREMKLPSQIINCFKKASSSSTHIQKRSSLFTSDEPVLEEYMPRRTLLGKIPETLLDAFAFWKVSSDVIIGYPKSKPSSSSGKTILEWWGASSLIHITLFSNSDIMSSGGENEGWSAQIRRIPQSISESESNPPMVLINPLTADHQSSVLKLMSRMVQLDSISHILLWSYSLAFTGEEVELSVVELPRLRLRFAVQLPESSMSTRKRLFSLDHSDLFMTEEIDENRLRILQEQSNCLLNGLVMENRFNQLFLLVPNYGLRRVNVRSCPFSSPLIPIRNEKDWSSHVRTCYYLYPIHPSGSFVLMSSLAGSLYLILLRFLQRQYKEASTLISSCSADTQFTEEEKWILRHIKLTESDYHPDAHAIRLRLAILCLEHTPGVVTWDVEENLYGYLHKYSHTASSCKLTAEEERLLLEFVTNRQDQNPIQFYTILRLRYLNALEECKRTGKSTELTFQIQERFGGARLRGLYVHSDLYCKEQFTERTKHFFYNYKRPRRPVLVRDDAVKFLLDLYDDNMSGQEKRTGFAAILDMLFGHFQVRICSNTQLKTSPPHQLEAYKHQLGDFDENIYSSIQRIERKEGERAFSPNFTMIKLLVHSLYFRYITPRGIPPETAAHFAMLSILISMMDTDRHFTKQAWRIPQFPYSDLQEMMDKIKPNAHPTMKQGIWGDVSEGKADNFENLLTAAVVYHVGSPEWKDNSGFHYPAIAKQGYYSEKGLPGSVPVNPNTQINCRPEIDNFDCESFNLAPFDYHSVDDAPPNTAEILKLLNISNEDISAFSTQPLSVIDLTKFIVLEAVPSKHFEAPFSNLQNTPAANTSVARSILHRINKDIEDSCAPSNDKVPRILSLREDVICTIRNVFLQDPSHSNDEALLLLKTSLGHLMELLHALQELQRVDSSAISKGVHGVELLANQFPLEPTRKDLEEDETLNLTSSSSINLTEFISTPSTLVLKLAFLLERQAGQKSWLNFHLLCRAFMCRDPWVELYKYNPFLTKERCQKMLLALSGILFRSVRVSQINTCIASTQQLISVIKLTLDLEMDRRWFTQRKKFSQSMKLYSLEYCNFSVLESSKYLETLITQLHKLQKKATTIPHLSTLKPSRLNLLAFIIFHYTNFDMQKSELLLEDAASVHLINLAKRSCFYNGVELQLPIRKTKNDPFINMLNSIELDLSSSIDDCTTESKLTGTIHLLQHTAEQLASNITSFRNYVINSKLGGKKNDGDDNGDDDDDDSSFRFDPRFLVFEFVSNFLLKERQIDLVNNFMHSYREGRSSVHQMIMGAGKTTVICPLLSLLLANGESLVTLVIPSALLDMSRDVMRNCFSNVIVKKVYSFHFDRYTASSTKNQLATIRNLRVKLEVARDQRGIVCTTPEVIKSLMLMYIDILSVLEIKEREYLLPTLTSPFDAADIRSLSLEISKEFETANEIAKILLLWKDGIALLDEVDVILHPLYSELNFPIGEKQPLPLSPHRWQLPFHLLDCLFSASSDSKGKGGGERVTPHAALILEQIHQHLKLGAELMCIQYSPHLVLVQRWFYEEKLLPLIAEWALIWLYDQSDVQRDLICIGDSALTTPLMLSYISSYQTNEQLAEKITKHFSSISIQFLNLTRDWILSYLPHCLSKIDRVHYGLLQQRDLERYSSIIFEVIEATNQKDMKTQSSSGARNRQLLSIPFVGKDVPSQSSEFSHPDVLIGLSVFAYRYEGIRSGDITTLIRHLKHRLSLEPGEITTRPCNRMFEAWLESARSNDLTCANITILPLDVIQPEDPIQIKAVQLIIGKRSEVIEYYLDTIVFPLTMHHQPIKLQATGQDLGSNMIFGMRMGFSGTPSDCLPQTLRPCRYEPGSEAKFIETLSKPEVVTVEILQDWNVASLIKHITHHHISFNALIDAGALITGMNNEHAARTLLASGLSHVTGCVFLDDLDRKMIVDRSDTKPIPLSRSGIPIHKRFSFYDQVHTTGMDIQQSINAKAVLLLGKDMTLRDYAQACWRMRGLGRGQSVHVIVVKEVFALIESVSKTGNLLVDIINWLVLNTIKSEHLQHIQLCQQDISYVWRKKAMNELLSRSSFYFSNSSSSSSELKLNIDILNRTSDTTSTIDELAVSRRRIKKLNKQNNNNNNNAVDGSGRSGNDYSGGDDMNTNLIASFEDSLQLVFRDNSKIAFPPTLFHEIITICQNNLIDLQGVYNKESNIALKQYVTQCMLLFKEVIDFKVLPHVPQPEDQTSKMKRKVNEFQTLIDDDHANYISSIIDELSALESEAKVIMKGSGSSSDYDAEIVQEQEQQQQQQVQTVTDEEIEYSMERNDIKSWRMAHLCLPGFIESSTVFQPLSELHIWSMLNPQEKASLKFPDSVMLSVNHTKPDHRSSLQRRLRPVYTKLVVISNAKITSLIINLAEAESIRHHLFNNTLLHSMKKKKKNNNNIDDHPHPQNGLEEVENRPYFSLYTCNFVDGKCLYNPLPVSSPCKLQYVVNLQCIRFFNCDFKFSKEDIAYLLDGLANSSVFTRKKYFELLLLCHDKLVNGWESTSVAPIFQYQNQQSLVQIQLMKKTLSGFFAKHFTSLVAVFQTLDVDHDGFIAVNEFASLVHSLTNKNGEILEVLELEQFLIHYLRTLSLIPPSVELINEISNEMNLDVKLFLGMFTLSNQ